MLTTHRLVDAVPNKAALTPMPTGVPRPSALLTIWLQIEVSHDPFSFNNLLEWHTYSEKRYTSKYSFITEDIGQE